jgi:hypothetical protein
MIIESDVVYINVTQEMRDLAEKWYRDRGEKYGSMYDPHLDPGKVNVLKGYIGEAVYHFCYPDAEHVDESHKDFIHFNTGIDIKTECVQYYDPKIWFQIPDQDLQRLPDIYVFMQTTYDFTQAWIFGWISHAMFVKNGTQRTKGEKRFWKEGKPDFEYLNNCKDVQVMDVFKLNMKGVVEKYNFASWWVDEVEAMKTWSPQGACRRLKNI